MQEKDKLSDTNYRGNAETREAIEKAKDLDLGPSADKGVGLANALASLNVAESLQMFQTVLENQTNKIISSNNKHSRAMFWLTLALVFVGGVTAWATITTNDIYRNLLLLEEAGKEPVLSIYVDQPTYLGDTEMFADIHIENVGPVPVHELNYGFLPITQGREDIGEHLIKYGIQEKVLSVGEEISVPIFLQDFENVRSINEIWMGLTFSRFPGGEPRCLDMIYVTLPGYENNDPSDCGKWWDE